MEILKVGDGAGARIIGRFGNVKVGGTADKPVVTFTPTLLTSKPAVNDASIYDGTTWTDKPVKVTGTAALALLATDDMKDPEAFRVTMVRRGLARETTAILLPGNATATAIGRNRHVAPAMTDDDRAGALEDLNALLKESEAETPKA